MERNAVVTGAAQGIGLAISRALLGDGLNVVGVDQNGEALSAAAHQLAPAGRFMPKVADLADPAQVQRLFGEVTSAPWTG